MTVVEVLCLNHKQVSSIAWSGLNNEIDRFQTCVARGHRMFHFYGGVSDPTIFSWTVASTDIASVKRAIDTGYSDCRDYRDVDTDRYLDTWQELASHGYIPDWFMFRPKLFFGTDDFEQTISPEVRELDEIIETLTVDTTLDDEEYQYGQRDVERGHQLKQAFYDCKLIDRENEVEFLNQANKWQKSTSIEQQWLAIMSMNHYLRKGIVDSIGFYNWLRTNLLNQSYLIRSESFDMLQSLVVTDQQKTLELIQKLVSEKEFMIQACGFDLIRRAYACYYYTGRYDEQLEPLHRPVDEPNLEKFTLLCETSSQNVVQWVEHLVSLDSYWPDSDMTRKEIAILQDAAESIGEHGLEYYISIMSRLSGRIRFPKDFFEIKDKSSS